MTPVAAVFFLLGFAASWIAGRYVEKGASLIQGGAIAFCGVGAMLIGMPGMIEENFIWGMVALLIYGLIGALIFRSGQAVREKSE